ncbi:MAG: bifunctional phosphopantothenoylcysteine decarboxylase/phosphopantothenate--cysteine ligase CoaBC [Bacteroidales bacterium]|nr:bifunctional phosphopantothenoylcysteine decarboxylase/phosphopantothenate--cysteine ligase CoaBC [Bacteroidales bacterium]
MRIVLGITGGIAAYKAPQLVRLLVKAGHEVQCAATDHALQFVTRVSLETVSGRPLYNDLFSPANNRSTEHISLKDWGDALVVAPATANFIGKLANGIADDALSTLALAFCGKPIMICPAMNTQMWFAPPMQRNMGYLRSLPLLSVVGPEGGELACGTTGDGRMSEPETIAKAVEALFANPAMPLTGQRVLVTAGPTYERIDSVRFVGNYSSGNMGFALARSLAAHGAEVDLVSGPTHLDIDHPAVHLTRVESAREMYDVATALYPACQAAILSAAVADYRPEHTADHKLKKQSTDGLTLHMVQNPDILASLGASKRKGQTLIGFALETDNEEANASAKLQRKNLDYIVLNSLRDKGAGFGVDTNKVTIMGRDGSRLDSPLMSKQQVADLIVEHCLIHQQ